MLPNALTQLKKLAALRPGAEYTAQLHKLYDLKFAHISPDNPLSKQVPAFEDWVKVLPEGFDPASELATPKARGGLAKLKECSCHG